MPLTPALPTETDVVIVGGGLAGMSAAAWLAPHHKVLLVEQGTQPGGEATAQNAGMVRLLGEDPAERALAVRTAAHLGSPPGELPGLEDASQVTGAVLAMAHDPWHLHDGVAALRARGLRVEACDRPWELAPALEGAPLVQAWHVPAARVADAWLILQAAARGAGRHGAQVCTGVRTLRVLVENGHAVGIQTDSGAVRADRVILAAGAWSGPLGRTAGVGRALLPVRRTLLQSAADPRSQPGQAWAWIDDVGIYVRPEGTGWLVSGCDETPVRPPEGPGSRGPVHPAHRALADHKLGQYFPCLSGLRWTGGWTGLRTFAPDRRPVLGADPDCPGLWWIAGLGGFGVSCGIAAAAAVAAWIDGRPTPWLRPADVAPDRPQLRRWAVRFNGDLARARLVRVEG